MTIHETEEATPLSRAKASLVAFCREYGTTSLSESFIIASMSVQDQCQHESEKGETHNYPWEKLHRCVTVPAYLAAFCRVSRTISLSGSFMFAPKSMQGQWWRETAKRESHRYQTHGRSLLNLAGCSWPIYLRMPEALLGFPRAFAIPRRIPRPSQEDIIVCVVHVRSLANRRSVITRNRKSNRIEQSYQQPAQRSYITPTVCLSRINLPVLEALLGVPPCCRDTSWRWKMSVASLLLDHSWSTKQAADVQHPWAAQRARSERRSLTMRKEPPQWTIASRTRSGKPAPRQQLVTEQAPS